MRIKTEHRNGVIFTMGTKEQVSSFVPNCKSVKNKSSRKFVKD